MSQMLTPFATHLVSCTLDHSILLCEKMGSLVYGNGPCDSLSAAVGTGTGLLASLDELSSHLPKLSRAGSGLEKQ